MKLRAASLILDYGGLTGAVASGFALADDNPDILSNQAQLHVCTVGAFIAAACPSIDRDFIRKEVENQYHAPGKDSVDHLSEDYSHSQLVRNFYAGLFAAGARAAASDMKWHHIAFGIAFGVIACITEISKRKEMKKLEQLIL